MEKVPLRVSGHCGASPARKATGARLAGKPPPHNNEGALKQLESACAASPSVRMKQPFRVVFNSPQSGYMSVGLHARARELVAAVAYQPDDSLRELIVGLTALLEGATPHVVVRWNCEPDELDFDLKVDGARLKLEVVHYLSHRRASHTSRVVFALTGTTTDICAAFWKSLRELHRDIEVDEFARHWRREFPEAELRALTHALRNRKRATG